MSENASFKRCPSANNALELLQLGELSAAQQQLSGCHEPFWHTFMQLLTGHIHLQTTDPLLLAYQHYQAGRDNAAYYFASQLDEPADPLQYTLMWHIRITGAIHMHHYEWAVRLLDQYTPAEEYDLHWHLCHAYFEAISEGSAGSCREFETISKRGQLLGQWLPRWLMARESQQLGYSKPLHELGIHTTISSHPATQSGPNLQLCITTQNATTRLQGLKWPQNTELEHDAARIMATIWLRQRNCSAGGLAKRKEVE